MKTWQVVVLAVLMLVLAVPATAQVGRYQLFQGEYHYSCPGKKEYGMTKALFRIDTVTGIVEIGGSLIGNDEKGDLLIVRGWQLFEWQQTVPQPEMKVK